MLDSIQWGMRDSCQRPALLQFGRQHQQAGQTSGYCSNWEWKRFQAPSSG